MRLHQLKAVRWQHLSQIKNGTFSQLGNRKATKD